LAKSLLERVIGSIRREYLNHIIIFNECHLRGVLSSYFQYYHQTRKHLSLDKDCPDTRPVHRPAAGKIIAFPEVGGYIIATNAAPPKLPS
jgi:putative transposase